METQTQNPSNTSGRASGGAKDFFINLGAIVGLYTLVVSLLNLLFTVINRAYPKITDGYSYFGSQSISWPVATLIIFFPIFIFLMWFMAREYTREPEMKNHGIHKWLTYITLFIAGLVIAGDLITVLYYFIDGQELTYGFLLKVLVLLIVVSSVFIYYISDLRNKLTPKSRISWRIFAGVIVLGSIIWGFSVLGSPRTQQLFKYDEQKVNDLMNIDNTIKNYYTAKGYLPKNIEQVVSYENYYVNKTDSQTGNPYEYEKIGDKAYNLCAEFNKATNDKKTRTSPYDSYNYGGASTWVHPVGRYCFGRTINSDYLKPVNVYPM